MWGYKSFGIYKNVTCFLSTLKLVMIGDFLRCLLCDKPVTETLCSWINVVVMPSSNSTFTVLCHLNTFPPPSPGEEAKVIIK